jgi:hypothetical protein
VQVLKPTNVARDHPLDSIISDISRGVWTRSGLTSFCERFSFVLSIEPKKIDEALKNVDCVNAMHEELNNLREIKYKSQLRGLRDTMWLELDGSFMTSKIKMG